VTIKLEEADEDLFELWELPEWTGEVEAEERGVPIGEPVIEDEEKFMAAAAGLGVVVLEGEQGGDEGDEGYDGDDEGEEFGH
jgi:hypothetical protein